MDSRASALSDLLLEWEERRERGEPTDPELICATRLDLLAPFQEMVAKLLAWERLDPTNSTDTFPRPLSAELPRPSVAGFTVHEQIGAGATSVVYRAEDVDTGLTVAVKVLRTRAHLLSRGGAGELLQRFEQEARLLARLNHDGIVRIFLSRLQSSPPFFVMEYLPGGGLAEHAPRLRAIGPVAVARFVESVARAVGFAHRHGTLHRDLKPSNILLDANGRPHVSDFGIAKLLAGDDPPEPTAVGDSTSTLVPCSLTVVDRQPGTLPYMAPEQYDPAFGAVGFATDVWALGIILYELLAGTRPFDAPEGAPRSAWRACVCRAPAPPLRLGRGRFRRLAWVAARCLEKDPARRYPDANALADALRDCGVLVGRRRFRNVAVLAAAVGLGAATLLPRPQPPAPIEKPQRVPESAPMVQPTAYHTSTEKARAALGRGEAVDLVPRVAAGAHACSDGDLRVRACPDGFTVEYNSNWALLEVMPSFPPGKYTLEAELRHDANGFGGEGDVGLYCWGCSGAAGRPHHVIAALTFADRGRVTRYGARVVTYSLGDTMNGSAPFPPKDAVPFQATPGSWRRLTWHLVPASAAATFDGVPLPPLMAKHFAPTINDAARAGVAAQIRPDGAFGIYVSRGKLTVRHLRVVPDGN